LKPKGYTQVPNTCISALTHTNHR